MIPRSLARRGPAAIGSALRALGRLAFVMGALAMPALARATVRSAEFAPLPLAVTMVNDTALTLDSNSPATSGPHAMYVTFRITNTSGAAVSNVSATLSGFGAGIVLAGGQAATQFVGTVAAGQSRVVYWFITYPSTFNVRQVLTVSITDGAGGTASGSGPVRTMAMISAQAGGNTTSSTIGAGAVVGQIIPLDVVFTFKGWKAGDTFNLQPAGNTSFPAGCFQLISTQIIAAENNLSSVMPPGTMNQQFFIATVSSSGGGSSWNVTVRYQFRYLCAGATGTPLPYSNELSGTQLKYSANFGSGGGVPAPIPPAPSPSASFTITKGVSAIQLPSGGTVTYTVSIQNISTFAVTIDSIMDVLPAGTSYGGLTASSGVTAANSGSTPAAGATGTITFRGNPGTTYAVGAGATLTLQYTVSVPNAAGQYTNAASAYVGTTLLGNAAVTVTVGTADVSLGKAGPASVAASDTVSYVLTIANAGPSQAYQVTAVDTLPVGVTFVRATRGATVSGRVVTWPALATLASGATIRDTVIVLAPASLGTIVNVARSTSATYDPAVANNDGSAATSRASVAVVPPVVVTPDGLASPVRRLPGTRYSQSFVVENIGSVSGSYGVRLTVTGPAGVVTIDSLTGAGITARPRADSAQVTLPARTAVTYLLWYTVPAGDTGQVATRLRAQHATQASYADSGWAEVRRAYPTIVMTKAVTASGAIVPGVDLTYTIRFRNGGDNDAANVVLTEEFPAQASFRLGAPTAMLPPGLTAVLSYSSDGGATWSYVPVSAGCGAAAGFDACVNRLRWTIGGTMTPTTPEGVLTYEARLR